MVGLRVFRYVKRRPGSLPLYSIGKAYGINQQQVNKDGCSAVESIPMSRTYQDILTEADAHFDRIAADQPRAGPLPEGMLSLLLWTFQIAAETFH